MKIKGKVELIQRDKIKAPKDGVHRNGSDGYIKGVHSVYMDGKLIPKGSVGFFYEINDNIGVKVYVGGFPNRPWVSKSDVAHTAFLRMAKLALQGLAPTPRHVYNVFVKWEYNRKKFYKKAPALEMDKIHYPVEAWVNYAKGRPYDWDAVDHPDHSPEGYHRFCEKLRDFAYNNGWRFSAFNPKKNESPKLGDVLFCTKKNKWFLTDVDR